MTSNKNDQEKVLKIIKPDKIREPKQNIPTTNDWTNIPYYPTTKERRENMAKSILSQGKQVPQELLKQIENDTINEVKNDIYNKSIVSQQVQQQQQFRPPPPPNKFSAEYAKHIGHKPKATASARIHLGGVY